MKTCGKCKTTKPISDFYKRALAPDGKDSRCIVCAKAHLKEYRNRPEKREKARINTKVWCQTNKVGLINMRLRKYGLTAEAYDLISEKQNNKCAICKGDGSLNKRLAVDHCHNTGKIRALLCTRCNTAIGLFLEDTDLLSKAIEYLKKHADKKSA